MRLIGLAVVLSLTLAPLAVKAQQPTMNVPRVGVLMFMPMTKAAQDDFRRGFREQGYVEGQNIVVEWRSAEGSIDRANVLAADLVRLKVDIILAEFTPSVRAAKNATQTIPIVMASAGDPRQASSRVSRDQVATSPASQILPRSFRGSVWNSFGRSFRGLETSGY